MKKFDLKQKFLFALFFIFIFACFAEAAASKADNIANLFTRVNPSLNAKKAQEYANLIIQAAEKFNQDPYVIAALIVHESTVNNKAVSKGGDYGLMQIRWKVHSKAIKARFPKVKKAKDILDAKINIFYGTEIFSDCVKNAGGKWEDGVLRYSAGNKKLLSKVTNTIKELNGTVKKQVKAKKKK